ncbi:myocardin-related transcription factor B-like isoform X2 [Mercenaria mercenaria]|nr:myocardin-related transcription factor B-like isoform X2 [Mercenaria mercenaria]
MDQQAAERAKAAAASGEDNSASGTAEATSPQQPPVSVPEVKQEPASPMSPQQFTDEASIMGTLDKNKESLKRKLMMRRSLNELVDQGIYPPPKTPPAFMEQRKSLERAKIGDSLRFKISHRPDRQQLVQQHILEDTNIDPSLHERQRLLKKARLADSLNDKLLHRPGVLELVQGNIIQTDGKLTQLIKEGSLSFDKATEAECSNDSNYDDGKSSDEAFSPDQTDDSNLSDISSPPVIPPAPELPTSFAKSLPFSAQIQFHQDSKVTLPLTTQSFTIPHQTTSSGGFGATATFVSPRSNVTVSTINNNNNNKSRPKKAKPKPQPKAKVIKFHEYKGPPNVVKSSQPVPSPPAAIAGAIGNTTNIIGQQPAQQATTSDTPYHILLQQQQLFLQWQLEFNQKNLNATTVLVPAAKDGHPSLHTITSSLGSSVATSVTESAAVSVNTQATPQTVFTVTTPTSQHAQPQAQLQQIRISSPVMTQIKQEPQLGQPQPQMNPNVTPVTPKPPVKKPTVNITSGPPKQYTSLEEMKVAELKAELKKRNLTVSGPKPQLIERLKPYADAILKCPSDKSPGSVQSPGSSILSPSGSLMSSKSATSPQSFSVMSPPGSVTSPQGAAMSSKTVVISAPGSSSSLAMTLPVVVSTFSGAFSQPGSVQSNTSSLTSPGSVASSTGSVTSPAVPSSSQSGSVFSRPGSVMSPLGSVIDETLCNNADSPLASIQSMQSAVSVSNMMFPTDDLSNPFSPPQSPLFMDNVMTPLSPDLMDIHVQSPGDLRAVKPQTSVQMNNNSVINNQSQQNQNNMVQTNMEQSRPPSVLSVAPSETDKHDMAMDIDLDLTQSLSTGLAPTLAVASAAAPVAAPPPPPLPTFPAMSPTNRNNIKAQQDDQQQMLNQIQAQLRILQEKQKQNQKNQMQQGSSSGFQMSQEELLKQQQEKIEKLQSQLEESQLRLQLQQLQHQQLQTQQQQLQQLQQQALQQQAAQNQLEQQHHQMQQNMQQQQHVASQQNIQVSASQQQQHQQSVQSAVAATSTQQVPMQTQQTAVQAQPNVSVPGHSHIQPQMQMQGQPQVQLQGQPPLAVQVPRSSPNNVQCQNSIAQTQPSVVHTQSQQKSQQHTTQKQVPTTSAQVIFSVPTIPNGSKAPTLANLPPNMKQIQIPAHLLHAFQNSQGLPAVILTQNPKAAVKKTKAPSLEFIKNQAINQTLNLGGGRSLIAVSTATGGTQQFIIATAPTAPKTSTNAPQTSTPAPTLNGLSQPPVQKMATSLPTSPVEGNQRPVARTSSNPFFIPMKEPPKYDEVVKNKQNKGSEGGGNDNVEKSQTMDDVLEILIRTGELPASAAQEPPPTPKTTSQSQTVPTISVAQSSMVSIPNTQFKNQSVVFSTPTHNVSTVSRSPNSQYSEMKGNIDSVYVPMEGLISASASSCGIKTEVKSEPCETGTSGTLNAPDLNAPEISENSHDFFDLSDVINSDLNAMDWTPDPAFGDLDLTDMTNTSSAMDLMPNDQSFLSIPNEQSPQRSIHGSEPDLANLGLTDMDTNTNMQIDVPDWLDVIMPNTGLTPLSANAPVSFPADPILTPQTQKEVLDLFNFDESDLNTPSDLNCVSAWDKLTETTSH